VAQPQRPFIPHPTPSKPRPAVGLAEFRLSRPFVPGSESSVATPPRPAGEVALERESAAAGLPGIEEFLQAEGTAPIAAVESIQDSYDDFEEPDELPPVEHFLDPLPPVSNFADEFPSGYAAEETGSTQSGGGAGAEGDEGWLQAAWQNYDWKAAATLGETGESEASNAWAETDWESMSNRANLSRPTAAQAIASALDEIARRIRDGDLVVPPSATGAAADPMSIADTLASMLGIRK